MVNKKKRLIKNKVKNQRICINICAAIAHSYENVFYDIMIEKTFGLYNSKKFDIFYVENSLSKKVADDIWKEILNSS